MKKEVRKFLAVVISVLVVSMAFTFAFSLSSSRAEAQDPWGCCLHYDDEWCVDDVLESKCRAGGSRIIARYCSRAGECNVGLCRPKIANLPIQEVLMSECQAGKHRAECEAEGGGFVSDGGVCETGCCQVPNTVIGRVCEVLPKFVCEEVSRRDGGAYEFEEGLSGEECYARCAPEKLGCCVLGGGDCKYQTRGECEGTFYEGLNCYEVGSPQCVLEENAMQGCCSPAVVGGGEIKRAICWFDSQGNQQDPPVKECDYPESKCEICNEESCEDYEGNSVNFGKPYCKSRSCSTEGALGSQKVRKENGNVVIENKEIVFEEESLSETLIHGQSVCYNFFTKQDSRNTDDNSVLNMYGRSTGLQSQVLRCFEGEIEIQQLGVNREEICVETSAVTTEVVDNNWETCRTDCAGTAGFWNSLADAFLAVPSWVRFWIPTASHCKEDVCVETGQVKIEGRKVQMCWYNYDTTWPDGGRGIGSCDPVYAPGTNTQAEECGGGGDWMYNTCDEIECYSLGDLQAEELYGWQKITHPLMMFIPAFMAWRISLAPEDCVLEAALQCAGTGLGIACIPEAYTLCLLDRTKYVNPLCWASVAVKDAWGGGAKSKWLGFAMTLSGLGIPGFPEWLRIGLGGIGAVLTFKEEGNKTAS